MWWWISSLPQYIHHVDPGQGAAALLTLSVACATGVVVDFITSPVQPSGRSRAGSCCALGVVVLLLEDVSECADSETFIILAK